MSARQFLALRPIAPHRDADPSASFFRSDVLRGLGGPFKSLPAKYLYDARGSQLFDEITRLPEYYPTRAELEILREQAASLAALLPKRPLVVEFGSGSSRKFRLLLAALGDVAGYVPVDIAPEMTFAEAGKLQGEFPGLAVHPVAADFTGPFSLPFSERTIPRVGFFPGSTIGNFEADEARAFLRGAAETLGPGSRMIVGVDLVKDTARLEAAYNDASGVTAAFNRNILTRINRELGGDFDLGLFRHLSFFDAAQSRIEMHLECRTQHVVRVAGMPVQFRDSERIHTENSYKYSISGFQRLACAAGWSPQAVLLDRQSLFALHVLGLEGE